MIYQQMLIMSFPFYLTEIVFSENMYASMVLWCKECIAKFHYGIQPMKDEWSEGIHDWRKPKMVN